VKLKPAQKNWYRVAMCLHEFGQRLVAPRLQILEIFRVIGAEPHHHGKVADLGGARTCRNIVEFYFVQCTCTSFCKCTVKKIYKCIYVA